MRSQRVDLHNDGAETAELLNAHGCVGTLIPYQLPFICEQHNDHFPSLDMIMIASDAAR